MGEPNGKTVVIAGDLKSARVIHSFARLMAKMYDGLKFRFIAPAGLQMPEDVQASIQSVGRNHSMTFHDSIEDVGDADIIYITRLQEERFEDPEEFRRCRGKLRIDKNTLGAVAK